MAELYEVVNKIIENDLNDEPAEQEEVAEEREAQETREQEDTSEDTGYDNRGIDGTMSNSIGRGAVENFIKNSVYEKYNIDPQKMKDFSKLSPTEMISDFGSSVKELGQLRSDYEAGKYTKSEYKVLSSKVKGEISGKMLEMGSCRKSILEDVLLRSFGVSPAEVSNVRSFNDLVEVFKPDQEPSPDTERDMRIDNDLENQVDTVQVNSDIVVLDEVSMLDIDIMACIMRSLNENTMLVLVGDVDQIPSIGPGNVLADIINSEVVPVTRLVRSYRHGSRKTILTNAIKINSGDEYLETNEADFILYKVTDKASDKDCARLSRATERVFCEQFLAGGKDPYRVQVISPLRTKTRASVDELNPLLQRIANPEVSENEQIQYGKVIFRKGDKVMQISNNYDNIHNVQWYLTPVLNGMIRIGSDEDKELVFRAMIGDYEEFDYKKRGQTEAIKENIFDRAARISKNAKSRQDNSRKSGIAKIIEVLGEQNPENKVVVADVTTILDEGLTGVVAIKVAEHFNKPCILLKEMKTDDDTKVFGGSMRNFDNSPIDSFKDVINSCPSFNYCMGHPNAAGISINADNVENGIQELNERLKDVIYDTTYRVDFIKDMNDVDFVLINEMAQLENIVAKGIDIPLIAIENIELRKQDFVVKGKNADTLQFSFNDIEFIIFGANELLKWFDNCWDDNEIVMFDLVGEPKINDFNGVRTIQVNIKDINFNGTKEGTEEDIEDDEEAGW